MGGVSQRLEASKIRGKSEERITWAVAGQVWAKKHANDQELENLARCFGQADQQYRDSLFTDQFGSSAYSGAQRFFFAICPEYDGDRDEASDFWESVLGEGRTNPDGEFVQAFAKAVLEVIREIEGRR